MRDRIHISRAYEAPASGAGRRVLVDRLWPRGVSKADLADAIWLKDVAPSAQLRKWFGHRPERWEEFRSRYLAELQSNPAVDALRDLVEAGPVTLVYGARDKAHNQAVVLAEFLSGKPQEPGRPDHAPGTRTASHRTAPPHQPEKTRERRRRPAPRRGHR